MMETCIRWINAHLWGLLIGIALLRASFLWLTGLDLIGDESYYWDWSRQPDWCYFSKPPMVAWLIGAFTWLLGDSAATVRLPAVLLGTVFLGYFYATARAMHGSHGAALALLLVLATPVNVLANFLMTIDPPLYCFWMMSIYYLQAALFGQKPRAWWWAGFASAAALLSKQVAIALPIMLLIFLLISRERRVLLKREFLWYLLPVILAALLILWWNQAHDWVMFGHSKSHFGESESVSLLRHLQHARDFWLYQLLLLSPLIFVLVLLGSVGDLLRFTRLSAQQQFLLLMGPVLLLAVLLLSFLQKAQGNWSMPFYFTGLILLVGKVLAGRWQKSLKYALLLGYLMVGMTYVLPLLLQVFNLKDSALDPTKRFKNWETLAITLHQQRLNALPDLQHSFVVALGHRYLASQLAFYLPDHPKVYRFEESGRVTSQYEVWPGPDQFVGHNGFVISQTPQEQLPVALQRAFTRLRWVAEIVDPDKPTQRYYLYLGENLKYWPNPLLPLAAGN